MKKLSLLLALSLLSGASHARGEEAARTAAPAAASVEKSPGTTPVPAAAPKSQADLEYDAAWALYRIEAPAGIEHPSKEYFKWADRKNQDFAKAVRAFGEKYPTDPRRYEGWVQASYTGPSFITGFKPEFDTKPGYGNLISDDAAVLAYRTEQLKLLTQVIEAGDATPRQRAGGFNALLTDSGTVARMKGEKFDVKTVRPLVDRVVDKFRDDRAVTVVEQYAGWLRRQSAAEADAFEASLQSNPVLAAAMQRVAEERKTAAEKRAVDQKVQAAEMGLLKFTAADGREVDLAKLKGKVVLVDFWATWCGPCIAELPNVKKVYAAYRDKGFEVIGITLENPNARPTDTPEQAAAKLEAAKKKMLEFAAKNEMSWPQYFDGKWWKNDYAVKFGIQAIPATFLLDQDGRVAVADVRGEQLEIEVKRLLKL